MVLLQTVQMGPHALYKSILNVLRQRWTTVLRLTTPIVNMLSTTRPAMLVQKAVVVEVAAEVAGAEAFRAE